MADDEDIVESVTLLDHPMDRQGWSSSRVVLGRTASSDLVLEVEKGGIAAQMYVGDLYGSERSTYRVAAHDVPRLREELLTELFTDTRALLDWASSCGLSTEPVQWHGLSARPVPGGRFLLEGLRTFLAPSDQDEATTVASRLLWWLRGKDIPYTSQHDAIPYD